MPLTRTRLPVPPEQSGRAYAATAVVWRLVRLWAGEIGQPQATLLSVES